MFMLRLFTSELDSFAIEIGYGMSCAIHSKLLPDITEGAAYIVPSSLDLLCCYKKALTIMKCLFWTEQWRCTRISMNVDLSPTLNMLLPSFSVPSEWLFGIRSSISSIISLIYGSSVVSPADLREECWCSCCTQFQAKPLASARCLLILPSSFNTLDITCWDVYIHFANLLAKTAEFALPVTSAIHLVWVQTCIALILHVLDLNWWTSAVRLILNFVVLALHWTSESAIGTFPSIHFNYSFSSVQLPCYLYPVASRVIDPITCCAFKIWCDLSTQIRFGFFVKS